MRPQRWGRAKPLLTTTADDLMKTFTIYYGYTDIATVEIDEAKAAEPIKEMVEFWTNWEEKVEDNKGDYVKTWLQNLAIYIIRNGHPPDTEDEGWYPMDGSHGITLTRWASWQPDRDEMFIE